MNKENLTNNPDGLVILQKTVVEIDSVENLLKEASEEAERKVKNFVEDGIDSIKDRLPERLIIKVMNDYREMNGCFGNEILEYVVSEKRFEAIYEQGYGAFGRPATIESRVVINPNVTDINWLVIGKQLIGVAERKIAE